MTRTNVGCAWIILVAGLIAGYGLASCDPPVAVAMTPAYSSASTVKAVKAKPCKDPIVRVIRDAGWKGKSARVAYAVAWRESNHQPGEATPPDLGLFQINLVWSGTKYWPANPLDARSNAKAAHRIWKDHSWRPWALNASGTGVDMRDYSWSAWQIEHWVWRPYVAGLHRFDNLPRACRA